MSLKIITKLTFFIVLALAELLFLIDSIYGLSLFIEDENPAVPLSVFAILIVYAAIAAMTAAASMIRVCKKRSSAFVSGILMQVWLSAVTFGFLMIPAEIPFMAVLFLTAAAFILGCVLVSKHNTKKRQSKNPAYAFRRFDSVKAEFCWDAAASEYCSLHDLTADELTDKEKSDINDYAGMWIACFFMWIIRNDFYSDSFCKKYGKDRINAVKNKAITPPELLRDIDYGFTHADLCGSILPFINSYFERSYFSDYADTVRPYGNSLFCIDFSREIYNELEERISTEYKYFCISAEEIALIEEAGKAYGETRFDRMNCSLLIIVSEGVSREYVDLCINHLNNLPEGIFDELCERLYTDMYACECFEKAEQGLPADKRRLDFFRPDCMTVYKPYGSEPAFVIGGEADFEKEHGVAWSVRGDKLLEVGYRFDIEYSSPWNRENERLYNN